MGYVVIGFCNYRIKTAFEFVLTLGSGIKDLQGIFNAVVNALVIAGFEMQIHVVCIAAPVSTIEGIFPGEENSSSNTLAIEFCEDKKKRIWY